jgi:hypothetical protein
MRTPEQFGALLETLQAIRAEHFSDLPDDLVESVLALHVDDPEGPTLHRKVEALLEGSLEGGGDAAD